MTKTKGVIMAAVITGIAAIIAAMVQILPGLMEKGRISIGKNRFPIIGEIVANPRIVRTGEEVIISVAAVDPDEDALIYVWSADRGKVPSKPREEATITYKAPDIAGKDRVTILVNDNKGGEAKKSVGIIILAATTETEPFPKNIQVMIDYPKDEIHSLEEQVSLYMRGRLIGEPPKKHLWEIFALVHPLAAEGWWTQRPGVAVSGNWKTKVCLGGIGAHSAKNGEDFQIVAVITKEPLANKYMNLKDLPAKSYVSAPKTLTVRRELAMPTITITKIVPDNYIKGEVNGLNPDTYDQYKVIVYVKTNKWYIHPYEDGGEGLSFASINEKDSSWQIQTVKRQWPARKVAAFLVSKEYTPPYTFLSIKNIDCIAQYMEEGRDRL